MPAVTDQFGLAVTQSEKGTISTVADEICRERSDSVSNQTNSLEMFGSFLSCVSVNFESAAYYVIFHL